MKKKNGNITVNVEGYEIGKTTITGIATSGKKITFNVVVKAPLQEITGVRLADSNKKTKNYVYCSQKVQLEAITKPSKTTDKIKWAIDAGDKTATKAMKKLASLNGKGLLTAKKTESTTGVTVVASGKVSGSEDDTKGSQTFAIKVSPLTDIKDLGDVKEKSRNKFALTLLPRRLKNITIDPVNNCTWSGIESSKEKAEILPELLTWTSSKPKVVEVDQNGQISAMAAGKANVKVSFANSQKKLITKTIAVTVKQPVKAIALKQTDFTVNVGTKKNISLKVSQITPKGGKVDAYTWKMDYFDEKGVSITKPSGITEKTSAKNSATVQFDKTVPNGTVVKVTVETNSGAKAYATITVCNKTTKFKSNVAKSKIFEVGKEYKVEELLTFETVGSDTKYNEKIVSCVPNNDNVRVEKVDGVWTVRVVKVGTGSTKLTVKTGSKSTSVTLKLGLGSGSSN